MHVLIGFLGFIIALLMIVYRYKVVRFTGKYEWAEQKLGSGGSYTMVVIVALVVWFGTLMYATGSFDLVFGFLSRFN